MATLICILVLVTVSISIPDPVGARNVPPSLRVAAIVLSDPKLEVGETQIAQVTLRNSASAEVHVGVRLVVQDAASRAVGARAQKSVKVGAYDEERVLFRLQPPRRGGEYRVQVELYSADFRRPVTMDEPGFYAVFTVNAPRVAHTITSSRQPSDNAVRTRVQSFSPPEGLAFEAPDLVWENVEIVPANFLVGDSGFIRADLRNVGGDISHRIKVIVQYFNTTFPDRIEQWSETSIPALAPGDREQLEFEVTFPDDALLGQYQVVLTATAADSPEATPDNNRYATPQNIELSNIRLVFPDQDFVFDEAGLFLFRWESALFDEFKVQVGVDPEFIDEDLFFDIPQGEKWTQDQEVVPLSGELPDMAKGLLLRENQDTIYWRVQGRDSETGRTRFSDIRSFTITLSANDTGLPAPNAIEPIDLLPLDELQ